MDKPFYQFQVIGADARRYTFTSVGPRPVDKLVLYSETDIPDVFNLALADVEADGSLSYTSVRNNGDLERILATVAQTLPLFFAQYPTALVAFSGSTPSRTRLYQIVLAREVQAVSDDFVISGLRGSSLEPFVPNQAYDGFVVAMRTTSSARS
ncbi:hypothetical protein EJV47_23365 [Hymenobacter gummosus]|uniref:Uncharacterized protein n=1 Tax=Hymenobacter gummosus TaxID=1776032 RepID=A0A431TXC0_9BACT|nr:hypothetical protein [Hymenobacter gummosus]RTQ46091.1 hypothetical protein EJV47_23365 [Hymenobacter gummosus]